MNYYKYIGLGLIGLSFLACNFEEVNTNPYEVKPEMGKMDGAAIGASFTALQSKAALVGTSANGTEVINQYQVAYHLSADTWCGYFGQNNTWRGGNSNPNYFLEEGWCAASYRNSYTEVMEPWRTIKVESERANWPEAFALAQILKILSWHKTADMFGPIPYSKVSEPIFTIPYDSEEQVYQRFFDELGDAIKLLTPKAEQGAKILTDYDVIYKGDLTKWVKLANSLMLRLAMRIRYADATKAQKYAEMAVNHPLGIINSKREEAKMAEGAGLSFVNNIETLAGQYNETRMGSSIFAYLVGYEDPRISAYFKPSTSEYATQLSFTEGKYQAIPLGHGYPQNDYFKAYSLPNISKSTPTYILRASEVAFLMAEGALLGWNMAGKSGDVASAELYKLGTSLSFEENGLATSLVEDYLSSNLTPSPYRDALFQFNFEAPTQATPQWGGSNEQKLEKIIIQKWLALYPNGQEAWSEWRRTGYPRLHKILRNQSGGEISDTQGVRRLKYPTSGLSPEERSNLDEALKMLGGANTGATKLWWDKKR